DLPLGGAAVIDVVQRTDPLHDAVLVVEDGRIAHRDDAVSLARRMPEPGFQLERGMLVKRERPGAIDGGLVLRMESATPAQAPVFVAGLSGVSRPRRLL